MPALLLDDDLRILASNAAAKLLAPVTAEGRVDDRCHQVFDVTDARVGEPCASTCPVVQMQNLCGWSHSRTVEVHEPGAEQPGGGRRDCLVVRCATTVGGTANICFLGRSLTARSEYLARMVGLSEILRDISPAVREAHRLSQICLEAALSACSGETGEVFVPGAMLEPVEAGSHDLSSCGSAKDMRRSFFGGRQPSQFLSAGLPLLAPVPSMKGEPGEIAGIYLCAPITSEGVVVGSVGIYGARGVIDVVNAVRALSAISTFLGDRLAGSLGFPLSVGSDARDQGRSLSARLRIHLSGPLRLEVDGDPVPITAFRRKRSLTLLRLLATSRRQPVSRAILRETFWPDLDDRRAGTSLRSVLHDLRHFLKPSVGPTVDFVWSRRGMVGLDSSDLVWIDAEEMERKVSVASRLAAQGRVREAVDEYLAAARLFDVEWPSNEPEEWWAHSSEVRMSEVYDSAIKGIATLLSSGGRAFEARDALRAALEADIGLRKVGRPIEEEAKRLALPR